MKSQFAWLAVVGGLAGGCAESTPPPNDQWAAAQEQVGRATATAPAVPDAKLHLQLAQEDLARAKQLIGSDNKHAATLIVLANTEAQLASSLAAASQARDVDQQAESALQNAGGNRPGASSLQAPNSNQPTQTPSMAPATPVGAGSVPPPSGK